MKRGLTPRQAKLAKMAPAIALGTISKQEAMLKAGYTPETAHQQSSVLGSLRTNTAMQAALRKAGFTEELIAESLMEGVNTLRAGRPKLGYIQAGAELLDVVPSQKHQVEVTQPMTYTDVEQKAKTPAEARALAEAE